MAGIDRKSGKNKKLRPEVGEIPKKKDKKKPDLQRKIWSQDYFGYYIHLLDNWGDVNPDLLSEINQLKRRVRTFDQWDRDTAIYMLCSNAPRFLLDEKMNLKFPISMFDSESEIGKINDYHDLLVTTMEKGLSLYIHGHEGTGKSNLCCALLRKAIESRITCFYLKENEIVDLIHDIWGEGFEKNTRRFFEQITHADILIIDNVGKLSDMTPKVAEKFQNMLLKRCDSGLLNIISSSYNLSPVNLGSKLTSNLQERCWDIELTIDYRGKVKKKLKDILKEKK